MNIAIILAAGHGWRLNAGTKKAFVEVGNRPIIFYSLTAFLESDDIDEVMIVLPKGHLKEFDKFVKTLEVGKPIVRITGMDTRFKSLKKAVKALPEYFPEMNPKKTNIIIHNAANPLVTMEEISRVATALQKHEAAGVGMPVYDTLRRVGRTKTETVRRDNIWRMQTPQGLQYEMLTEGIRLMPDEPTDDLQLAELQGIKPKLFHSSPRNFKITTQHDLELLEDILDSHREYAAGLGEDSHAFAEDGKLVLGGVTWSSHPRLSAKSDGDVMIHALVTALLQALGMGSLGPFADPISDLGMKNSRVYLLEIMELVREGNWAIEGMEFMFECLTPGIDKIAQTLKESIAMLCDIDPGSISIAAHTGDGLTAFARGEGIRCQCLVSLARIWL